jgi:hypothetical protein
VVADRATPQEVQRYLAEANGRAGEARAS